MAKTRKQAEDEVEKLYNAVLSGWEPFNGDSEHEREADIIINEVNAARESGDARRTVKAMMLKDTLKTVIIRMVYSEDDPRDIPIRYLKHCLQFPARIQQFASTQQRAGINGPSKAIRIKCLECQGQDTVGVRLCPAVTCELWPFRMGSNPFFARMRGSEDEVTDAEIAQDEAEEDAREAAKLAEAINADT